MKIEISPSNRFACLPVRWDANSSLRFVREQVIKIFTGQLAEWVTEAGSWMGANIELSSAPERKPSPRKKPDGRLHTMEKVTAVPASFGGG